MVVRGEPGDATAREYADLAAAGESGVYLALHVPDHDPVLDAARALGLDSRESRSAPWRFTSFPDVPGAAAVFFMSGPAAQDPDSLLSHQPETAGIAEVWLEGGRELTDLLEHLGGGALRHGRRFRRQERGALRTEPRRSRHRSTTYPSERTCGGHGCPRRSAAAGQRRQVLGCLTCEEEVRSASF